MPAVSGSSLAPSVLLSPCCIRHMLKKFACPKTVCGVTWNRQTWKRERLVLCKKVQSHSDPAPSRPTLPPTQPEWRPVAPCARRACCGFPFLTAPFITDVFQNKSFHSSFLPISEENPSSRQQFSGSTVLFISLAANRLPEARLQLVS